MKFYFSNGKAPLAPGFLNPLLNGNGLASPSSVSNSGRGTDTDGFLRDFGSLGMGFNTGRFGKQNILEYGTVQ